VAFQSDRQGDGGIFWQAADGTGTAERLTKADAGTTHVPEAWSPTGSYFLFTVMKGITGGLWSFSLSERKGQPLAGVITNASGRSLAASFSPDGKWFLYSTETGLYVQPFPQTGATYQIGGGFHPWWTRDGKEIVFVPNFGRLGLIRISITPTLTFGAPSYMSRPFNEKLGPTIGKNYDVTPDGRFVGLAAPGEAQGSNNQIAVVLNWGEELKRLVPTR
jgi:Tol biopolymer transport system component